ncbi:SUBTILISIN-LIKE PROTEASE SBT3.18 [Salix viminalis]|uniref:SUBTILISIN-LIKE PROTEASE SBT3.18 n=1 Tax=Salix viminalis TaxID=40686 RepID=A0A9Q0TM31_SALVM|nr:SUBTILISIN-LIKE PROTEASE SBT3.18 [Salix viminalis]
MKKKRDREGVGVAYIHLVGTIALKGGKITSLTQEAHAMLFNPRQTCDFSRGDMAAYLQCFWGLSLSLSLYFIHSRSTSHVYVVYLGLSQFRDPLVTSKSHIQLLSNVFSSEEEAKQSTLYSYKHDMKGVISVFRSRVLKLHTTRSWDFIGLTLYSSEVTPLQLTYGDDVVVGVFDTGIWPESESFKEEPGLGPIPSSWKGKCVEGEDFEPKKDCNRKLIGARYYLQGFEQEFGSLNTSGNLEYRSARDFLGHGTHTASTAVGSIVKNASMLGFALGTARGGAPRARLAVYKIISASFGSDPPLAPFFSSSADIGSFHAMQLGVSSVFSAGNAGPDPSLVGNVAPWTIYVAASSIDRVFPTAIVIDSNFSVMACLAENWNKRVAKRKIILCFSNRGPVLSAGIAQAAVLAASGLGLIFVEPPTKQIADVDIIPTVRVDVGQGNKIQIYIGQSSQNPAVKILPSKIVIGKSPAPVVASFSSRGPSPISPHILKPDVTAPGVTILAAWPSKTSPTLSPHDDRRVNWNFQSGTSMSCPHVSGVVALLQSAHPDWSPAAIRSALMTTAYTRDNTFDSILAGGSREVSGPFDIGAGHIHPSKAMDPGLVYDMKTRDYIIFLCNIGYNKNQINMLVLPSLGMDTSCSRARQTNSNINYPSITVSNLQSTMTIKRTVRNVGTKAIAIYFVSIVKPHGVEVLICPRILIFSCFKEELSYFVTLKPIKISKGRYDFGEIVWSDGFHYVRSPLVVLVNTSNDDDPNTVFSSNTTAAS